MTIYKDLDIFVEVKNYTPRVVCRLSSKVHATQHTKIMELEFLYLCVLVTNDAVMPIYYNYNSREIW